MRRGFTLIEVLLALSIAAVAAVLIFSIYHLTTRILGDREQRHRGETAAVRALEQLSRDLAGSFHAEGYDGCAFDLSMTGRPAAGSSTLSVCTTVRPDPDEDDLRWHEVHHVRYHLETDGANGHRLVRTHQPLVGPGALSPPVTNALVERLEGFEVSVLAGEDWETEWRAEASGAWPRAARIALHMSPRPREPRSLRTEVLIPAGLPIEPERDRDAVRE